MKTRLAFKNIFSSLAFQLVSVICGFITPSLIIRTYGSEVNGLLSSIAQFLAYITLLESGFGPVMKASLYKPLAEKNRTEILGVIKSGQSFFRKIAYIFIAYIILLFFIYPLFVAAQFEFIFTASLVLIIGISTFFEYYLGMAYKLFLQANQKTYITSYLQIITLIFSTITTVVLIKLGCSIQVVKIASALIFIATPIAQNIYVKKHYDFPELKTVTATKITRKWHGLAQHIAAVIHNNTDIVVLTLFAGNIAEVSVYAVYGLIIGGVKKIVSSFTSGFDAMFGDLYVRGKREKMVKDFRRYELFFHTISTIAFICCLLLIVPFVSIYTSGVNDVEYIRPTFAALIVLSEFMHSIRLPYSSVTLAVGHFKETMIGAWVESGVNIIISILLVWNFGITGVAIGTLIAMAIRTVEFMYHVSKHILKTKLFDTFKWLFIIAIETAFVWLISMHMPAMAMDNYADWVKYAIIIFLIASATVIGINFIICHKDAKRLLQFIRKKIFRR